MAKAAGFSKRSIINISNNLRRFGSIRAPATRVGRRRSVTSPMIEALCDRLLEKPGLYLDEMTIFLWDEFLVQVTNPILKQALASTGWSKKVARQRAKEQNADLRDSYMHNLSDFQSYHLVYVDESGCDKRIGFRRTGWCPLGTAPLQVANFHRDQRYQILPAYCQDAIVLSYISGLHGFCSLRGLHWSASSTLRKMREPKSVLVIDNASFHRSDRIEELWTEARVILVYLPPYSRDLNPIEEFFSELKVFIRRNWVRYEEDPEQGFHTFLEWCIEIVGSREQSPLGHFRHAGVVGKTY